MPLPSQDILAGLATAEFAEAARVTPAETPVADPLAALAADAPTDPLAALLQSAPVSADALAQVEDQLSDPLLVLAAAPVEASPAPAPLGVWVGRFGFALNYVCVSAIIFVVLLGTLNWHAYTALAQSWLHPEKLQAANRSIENALAAAAVTDAQAQTGATASSAPEIRDGAKDAKRAAVLEERLKREKVVLKREWVSAKDLVRKADAINYNVEITPYDNRVIIPRLAKNIPLVNVENNKVGNAKDWNKIFETELEKGIIKYPGSADPGEAGNAFIFGHSSNFPWIKGDYNDVFALLDKLEYGDEVTVYFKQKKYVYVIREKHVVKPGYVNAMHGKEEAKQLTLMTCWPVGTTLNRLIVTGELKQDAPITAAPAVALSAPSPVSVN